MNHPTPYTPGQTLYAAPELDSAIPPGDTLRELIDEMGMSQAELARRAGLTPKHVNQVVKGLVPLSADMAQKLELVTGTSARLWSRLEADYQSALTRTRQHKVLSQHSEWAKTMPVQELVNADYLPATPSTPGDRVEQLLRFFGVASVDAFQSWSPTAAVQFHQSHAYDIDRNALAAWLRIGEIESAKRPVDAFDPARLRAALPALRALTREPMHLALSALVEQGRDLGVSIVFVPEISGTRSFGATRWSNKNPIIQLSLRGKTADRLWRTLFHEIGHVLLHDHRSVFIESSDEPTDASAAPDIEREADGFALDVLVPRELRPELQRVEREDDAIDLADRLGIDAAIIVAELHSQHLWRWDQGNRLRHRVDENDLPGVTQPASPAVKPARLHWKVPGSEQ